MESDWKAVAFDLNLASSKEFENFGGIEELTDYSIVNFSENMKDSLKRTIKEHPKKKKMKVKKKDSKLEDAIEDKLETRLDMAAWSNYSIPEPIIESLKDLGFTKPTPIQELVIPSAISGHQDILGAAETGSGKTLAFGIPIISQIFETKEKEKSDNTSISMNKPLRGLILAPTRELAIQVKNHLKAICKYVNVEIAVVVGGMAPEKQKRVLKKCPDLVIATPGRLWELIEEGEPHLNTISNVRYLVIDEADRMVEKGHFLELTQILSMINGNTEKRSRQSFVFSATLTLVHDPVKSRNIKKKGKARQKQKLGSLVSMIGMKEKRKVIDITRKTAIVDSLTESQLMCTTEEKDMYLYYFLLMYPGRTLVFCNSIDCVRRLRTILEYLGCNPLPLHASMHQRQRLKNLEKFESTSPSVLLATDVAARGLDIKGIEHVIHFQVPRTAEIYVHRSGRTARAQNEGFSLMLVESQEAMYHKNLYKTLDKRQELPSFPIDNNILKIIKERVTLVHSIDKLEHRMQRQMAQNRWFVNTAKDMDIDIEDENLLNDMGDDREHAEKIRQIKLFKKQLKQLISKPLNPKTFTGRYPTKSGKLLLPATLGSENAVNALKNRVRSLKKKKGTVKSLLELEKSA